jgi:8-hydroxy-5-deazaflavin:NADPH oxidoreductase
MQIAILGAGNVGGALGQGWARAGHAISYGVPDPAAPRHAGASAAAGGARVATVAEAVAGAEAIVLAVPWDAVPAAIAACGDLTGRLVLDVTNPLRFGPGGLELALGFDTSGGEIVAKLATGAEVFKTMNQTGYQVMADARGYVAVPTMFIAGDSEARLPVVAGLVEDLGFEAIPVGAMKLARLLEPYAMLWIHQAVNRGAPLDAAFSYLRRSP